jgi:hypothetical protein
MIPLRNSQHPGYLECGNRELLFNGDPLNMVDTTGKNNNNPSPIHYSTAKTALVFSKNRKFNQQSLLRYSGFSMPKRLEAFHPFSLESL